MSINWRKSDIKDLRNYVRKFNAKITRLNKKVPGIKEFLPERLSVQQLRESITERRDFNNLKKSVDRFMRKGAENLVKLGNGITTTKWQKKELEIKRSIINRRRAKAREEVGEVPQGRIGTVVQWENKALKRLEEVSKESWEAFVSRLEKQSQQAYITGRDEQYLANWVQGLYAEFGDEWANQIIAATSDLDRGKLINAIKNNDTLSLGFVYSLVELEARRDRLLAELSQL